ncbi:MAG: 5,10-methylenetetrahydromethanopterin reductase (Coenzyme F420-dependent N(5),N(10)-methylenetetrahydromethanopterin reductase) (Methylene-H(4)MPT reductase) [uncultured Thermomicrobiales bacterium]|uniref:5,10-methylenetetrahydromethanopterin reductase (Coenzyme F420-dependent N(5),N(10)-methylenetetrahydromethanopterin reductase) (Methylene-H(4)MPT reductase) n=1 Tax=uncultured Thermomicrobiales bacterium TaxID=1645740 RepID=A0A6J4VSG3_9BACT|nr:MAG: 5,10-methylenetetrahydromethanopterin reductase (Coenzyme F420-dependent N(5),N(10)-methylenetetrahydromethanopterin reductase) (Methylene-H(4)MPT reductase) [uncultured Thermomicrobiales bacterium]
MTDRDAPPTSHALAFCLDASPAPWASARDTGDREAVERAVARTVEIARMADETGVESLWLSEDPDGWDAFAVLGAVARETRRIRLGTGVTNPYFRHPSLIAASVSTLDLLSGGRAFLGLGRGQSEWYATALGMRVGSPVRALEETFDLLGQWWSAERRATARDGASEFLVDGWERTFRPLQDRVPIYLAAVGPRALRIAGRLADGVLFNDLSSLQFMGEAIGTVRAEAERSGRDPKGLSFYARAAIEITGDPEAVYERRKSTVALIHALPGMERLLRTYDVDVDSIIGEVRRAMRTDEILAAGGGFGDLRRGGNLAAARQAIPNDLMKELVIAGPVADVRARLEQFREIGVTHVFLAGPGPDTTAKSLGELLASVGGS